MNSERNRAELFYTALQFGTLEDASALLQARDELLGPQADAADEDPATVPTMRSAGYVRAA